MAALEVLALDATTPRIQAAQTNDTYAFPRPALFTAGSATNPPIATTGDENTGVFFPSGGDVIGIATGGTERFRISSAGNVGVGTLSPDARLDVVSTSGVTALFGTETTQNSSVGIKYNSTTLGYVGNGGGVITGGTATDFAVGSTGTRPLVFGTNDTERLRIGSGGEITISSQSLTGSSATSLVDASATWNTTGTPIAIKLNITDTASNAASLLLDLQVGGSTRFNVAKTGSITASNSLSTGAVETVIQNTSTGTAASAGVRAIGNSTAYSALRTYGTGNTATAFGVTLANYSALFSDGASSVGLLIGAVTSDPVIFGTNNVERLRINAIGGITLVDANDIAVGTTTGTKIGTATTQKIAFWNKTPIVQPTTGITGATFTANSGTTVNTASTFGGYTLAKVVAALINVGILA